MPKQTTRLEVVADGAKWSVREHGIGRLSSHPTKVAATAAARSVAAQFHPAELTIRNSDGTVESQHAYH